MIQRIQTVHLIFAFINFITGLIFYCEFFSLPKYDYLDEALIVTTILTFVSVFLYKNRKNQMLIISISMIINVLLIAFMVFVLLTFSGEGITSEKRIGIALLSLNFFLFFMALRGIKKDDNLVKSVDRFR